MANCEICGEPMPAGEEMFKFHGYSGNCPKPPLPKPPTEIERLRAELDEAIGVLRMVDDNNRVDAGEKRKAWDGKFVVDEVRRLVTHNVEHQGLPKAVPLDGHVGPQPKE